MNKSLPYVELGFPNGPPVLLLSGFPDSELSAWGEVIPEQLAKTHRCIFVCLPGYSAKSNYDVNVPWGYEQEDVLEMLRNTMDAVGLTHTKFVMIAHDWGAYYALLHLTRHPNSVSKLVLCDIGMCSAFSLPLTSLPFIAFYQLFFAITYFISQAISVRLAESLFQAIGIRAFFQILSPNRRHRSNVENQLTVLKCYPYYYLWRRLLTGTTLPQAFPTCPLLFMVSTV